MSAPSSRGAPSSEASSRGAPSSAGDEGSAIGLYVHVPFATYCRSVEEGGGRAAVAGERRLTARKRAAEALFTGLRRREGVDLAAYRRRHDLDPLGEWRSGLGAAQAAGLAVIEGGRLRLTDRGVLLSNEVFQAFV